MTHVAIITIAEDLHAYAVRQMLREQHGARCDIVETDRLPASGLMSWSLDDPAATRVPTLDGPAAAVGDWDVLWFRRPGGVSWRPPHRPAVPDDVTDPAAIDLIVGDCRAAFIGSLLDGFRGAWVSHPDATRNAENKLVQLRAARQAGLRVPATLVSQSPDEIRAFCAAHGHRVIVKSLTGSQWAPLTPGVIEPAMLADDRSLALAPAIYQAMVEGQRHLRVHAFGDEFIAAQIECPALDWRFHLAESTVTHTTLPASLRDALARVLQLLGLRMGVFDLKLTAEGEPVWLEVNPQGQFLFVEGLGDLPLAAPFADFLLREARQPLRAAA